MKINLIILLIFFLFISCTDNGEISMRIDNSLNNIKLFQNTNIYFGHQSVGNNIIEGLKSIFQENKVNNSNIFKLDIIQTLPERYFVHSQIGKNGNPLSKIKDFVKTIDLLKNKNLKIVMMKFCYADFNQNSDIHKIFQQYSTAIDSIKSKYPNLIIIHFTVPLMTERSLLGKLKAFVKGNSNKSFYDNLARNNFNDLIKVKYQSELIFDLAGIESTYFNGKREIKELDGKQSYFLIGEYSSDGGHLNKLGQKLVANELINMIAEISLNSKE